jgi:AcrR family transcriptional regulator
MREIHSTLRQRQAQATRELIAAAARDLFLEQGYSNTTIETIAERACVAVSTVYAAFGSKRGILRLIRETWHEQSHIKDFLASLQGDASPAELLDGLAEATRRQWQTGAQMIDIYRSAAAADREAATELGTALEGRKKGLLELTCHLSPYLRPGLDIQKASDILRTLCLVEVYEELVVRSGWTAEAYQKWLAEALKSQLLPN